jgi:hypothetical protein
MWTGIIKIYIDIVALQTEKDYKQWYFNATGWWNIIFFKKYEVVTAVVRKSFIFYDTASCTPLKRSFGGTRSLLILRPWTRGRQVPPKLRFTFNGIHGVISQNTELFFFSTSKNPSRFHVEQIKYISCKVHMLNCTTLECSGFHESCKHATFRALKPAVHWRADSDARFVVMTL